MQQGPQSDHKKRKKANSKYSNTALTFDSDSTLENAAFALATMREASEVDDVVSVITNLAYSPAFLLIAEEYRQALQEQMKLGEKDDNGNDFDLRLLCARCFIAGHTLRL
ncbi:MULTISPECIES: hypothetical protein [Acidobacteriaceae]|uniref:hypothetical protein n=1 Tax=Acidobacteriaceae TaxID=204434 RepID=UPI00131C544B|nr:MULTISPECIES: hypothetical protein [Acidobacteriaceae]MDW5266932.1 hypothetical protein [Edaphobacter sp.]